jgi:arylsulfatase A-like enzyme
VQAPEGAPNVLLILIDDCGFGQHGTFGGGVLGEYGRKFQYKYFFPSLTQVS